MADPCVFVRSTVLAQPSEHGATCLAGGDGGAAQVLPVLDPVDLVEVEQAAGVPALAILLEGEQR